LNGFRKYQQIDLTFLIVKDEIVFEAFTTSRIDGKEIGFLTHINLK